MTGGPLDREEKTAATTAATTAAPLFGRPLAVVNLGLEVFAETLEAGGVPVERVDWRPPAGGDEELARILDRLA